MPKIIMLPIEPLDARYSIQWEQWFTEEINKDKDFSLHIIDPKPLTTEITNGAFLDVCGTNYYKACQLQKICEGVHKGYINDGDVFLFHDLWFPGIEMLAYMRDALKINFKIVGCLHAGTYDPSDFISKMGMGKWGKDIETGWFEFIDQIFVATKYHKELIRKNRNLNSFKIKVTGFPIKPILFKQQVKENIVVFPHRLTDDKQPHLFDELRLKLAEQFPDWSFVKSQEIKRTKQEFYELLNRSKIAVSFALHENWGIAMQEAVLCGCIPIVPDRLSYREMYPDHYRYDDFGYAVDAVKCYMQYTKSINQPLIDLKAKFITKGAAAIPNMLNEIKNG
jgi:glycosyltransferase involved in cell wall biosynthesis